MMERMTTYPKPRLISLFAGVGGFDLGFEAAGFTTVGQCEIDEHATMVLERHWPTVPKHPDVTTLKPEHFGPAEVVTFGSPCQDLSVAGKRAGLAGERSGLFTAAMGYIRAMQEVTHGEYPRVVVWENVPGAFSSNDGHDFAAVLESMVGGSPRPTPPDGGWPSAGVAFGPQGAVEWRVFDSQYFGVAQRRRRIFVIYHPGGIRAGQVLLEPQGMPRDPSESNETRPHATSPAAGSARDGSREDGGARRSAPVLSISDQDDVSVELAGVLTAAKGRGARAGIPTVAKTITTREGARLDPEFETLLPVLNDQGGARIDISHGVTGTLRATSKGNEPIIPAPPVAFKIRGGVEVDSNGKGAGKSYLGSENKALTLGASQDQYLAEPIAFDPGAGQHGTNESTDLAPTLKANGRGRVAATPAIGFDHAAGAAHGMSEREETAPTLQASAGIGRAAVAYPLQMSHSQSLGIGIGTDEDPSYTLDTGGKNAVAAVAFAENSRGEVRLEGGDGTRTGTLSTGGGKPGQGTPTIVTTYAVRRLTPRECERLQAFPDDHTRYAPDGTEIADTHRYRMCGNAVTTTVAAWIARRIMHELHQTGTPAPHGVT